MTLSLPINRTPRVTPAFDERILLRRAVAGEGRAFTALTRPYLPWMMALARGILGSVVDAEDVVQESLIRAYDRLATFRGGSFKAWLRQIVTRQCYNHFRARKTRWRYESRASGSLTVNAGDEQLDAHEMTEVTLMQLSYPFREILLLRHAEELSIREISGLLGLGHSATKMRLMRARDAFWKAYQRVDAVSVQGVQGVQGEERP